MISPPRWFTAKAQSQRQWEQTKRSPKRRKASRNTKQVNNHSESQKGQSKWKNKTKQAKRQAKPKTSEIQRRRLPKDVSVNKDHQKCTEVHKSTEARRQSTTDLSLSRRRSNELQKGRWPCQKTRPTDTPKAHREAVYRDTHWEVDREVNWEVDRSSPTDKSKATGIRSTETRSEKSTEKSTEKSPGKVYQVNQHLEVNATYQWLPHEIYSTKHCTKAQESAATLGFGKYNHL